MGAGVGSRPEEDSEPGKAESISIGIDPLDVEPRGKLWQYKNITFV